jgi:GNAT superfamily N-acetyltransferase
MIRALTPADHEGVADLMEEMQAHYQVPCPSRAAILSGLEQRPAGAEILIAVDQRVVGFAAFSGIYPGPGLIPGFFLKEIYVAASHRGRGIGRALIAEMAEMAKARGYGRIDWTADRDDPRLLDFYRGLGAVEQPKKVFFRLAGDALRR